MKRATFAWWVLLSTAAMSAVAATGAFQGWRKFGDFEGGAKGYYFTSSVKPIHHVQTGKFLGYYVWAGWENTDGSYNKSRYSLYCQSGEYETDANVNGTADGKEENGQASPWTQPYMPGTFVWALAETICAPRK